MPKGHAPKRETKKAKKKSDKRAVMEPAIYAPTEVQATGKRRKRRDEEL